MTVLKRLNLEPETQAKLAKLGAGSGRLGKRPPALFISSGITQVDKLTGGIPRGGITLVVGPPSSGRTTLMNSALSAAVSSGEVCAVVDASDAFHPASAEAAGVDLERLLWVRCGGNVSHTITAAEIILQGGGFGLVVLDLGTITEGSLIPDSTWFRYRRAVENSPTCLLVIGTETLSVSCASLVLEMEAAKPRWGGKPGAPSIANPLLGLELTIKQRKPFSRARPVKVITSMGHEIPD